MNEQEFGCISTKVYSKTLLHITKECRVAEYYSHLTAKRSIVTSARCCSEISLIICICIYIYMHIASMYVHTL